MPRLAALSLVLLAACATPPVDAVQERLDAATGTTVTRLASPVELLATAPRARDADPYVYVAPFETNRMGARRLYLWVAAPADSVATPAIGCGALSISAADPASSPEPMGLSRLPYRSPAGWYVARAVPIDAAWLACFAARAGLAVSLGDERFVGDGTRQGDLQQFAERLKE